MENEFLKKCIEWLQLPANERDLMAGAMLMLQASRNKILYQNMIRKPNPDKIEYEIQKYVKANKPSDMEGFVPVKNITDLDQKVYELEKKEDRDGKRSDHDNLPEDIKALVDQNVKLYHEMRSLHEKLKVYSAENYSAEKREPLIVELLEKNDQVRKNWEMYDKFDPNKPAAPANTQSDVLTVQDVQKHRTYLSRAAKEISDKIEKGKADQAEKQRAEAQKRYDLLVKGGQKFDVEIIEKLKLIGINVG